MADFNQLLEEDFNAPQLRQGAVVLGKLVQIDESGIFVDIGTKREGILPLDQVLPQDLPRLQVGDTIKVKVMRKADGVYMLSKKAVDYDQAWNQLQAKYKDREQLDIVLAGPAKNGYLARAFGIIEGFVHRSNFEDEPEVGGTYKAYILDFDRRNHKLVFTRRQILREHQAQRLQEEFDRFQPGMVVEGVVESITPYGAFVKISDNITGLLHISELAWRQVKRPSEIVKKGDKIMVKVLDVEPEEKKVSLSLKATQPDPLLSLLPGEEMTGTVETLADFGIFVRLPSGITGLAHASELSYAHFEHPSELFKKGQKVKVKLLKVDVEQRRISLSVKACEQDPWVGVHEKYQVGQEVGGTITRLLNNGMVVRIDDFFEGFVPIGEIAIEHIEHPKKKHRIGETITTRIINIDKQRRRIRLSRKALLMEDSGDKPVMEIAQPVDISPTAGPVTLGDLVDTTVIKVEEEE
ncbi:MAG: hypothetical protein B1H03_05940 [Planctomycetales bacterium 4484_113]|nr:MAG: hypothetical protein B1H03_05940 [Planctomycetales bacterium 4484_113]